MKDARIGVQHVAIVQIMSANIVWHYAIIVNRTIKCKEMVTV